MSQDSSDSDGLADWALVSQEGSVEGDEISSGSGSSDEFVNVTHDGVVYRRHRSSSPEAGPVSQSLASSEMSALLQSSLDEVDQDEANILAQVAPASELDVGELHSPFIPITEPSSSLTGSMASTGDESTDIITEDEQEEVKNQQLDSSIHILLPPSINIASSLSSLSQVHGLPASTDTAADGGADVPNDGAEVSDDGVVSLSTDSSECSKSEIEEVEFHLNHGEDVTVEDTGDQPDDASEDADLEPVLVQEDVAAAAASDVPEYIDTRVNELKRDDLVANVGVDADSGVDAVAGNNAASVEGACGEGSQWLKYPAESSGDQCHTIRLGDGRVIVAPPGADLESLAVSLHLSNKSETSSDTGSDSDFVRLEAISSCSSSNENTDTEGDELVSREELPAPVEENEAAAAAAPVEDVMAESVSSVSSRFRFLPPQNGDAPAVPQLPPDVQEQAADDNNDGDTESMSGHSEDDRIESDQSEANIEQLAEEEEERALNDIGDIPLVAGHRQYVHKCNKHLNWTLDVVVIMVILMTIGIGIGHSIGSMREQAIQEEMKTTQLNQLSNLHKKVLQLVKRNGILKQVEAQHLQELEDLSSTNNELRSQLDAMADELTIKVTTLSQYRESVSNLQEMQELFKTEINKLQQQNKELLSRIADLETKAMSQENTKKEELEKLKKQANLLKIENANLKAEIARLRFLLPHSGSESVNVHADDDGYSSMEDISTSCSKPTESQGKMTDLKARINLLEQENADMRAEIGRLRYKSHPGNVLKLNRQDRIVVEQMNEPEEHDEINENVERNSADEILKLKSELHATKRQAANWERLYMSLKGQGTHTKCNISMDFFSCMNFFTMQINNSINATAIKDFLNVSKLLLSVEDVKDAFVSEFQNIWKEFSGSGNKEKQEKTKEKENTKQEEKPATAQKKWSDSVKDILNRTQSSVSDMSQQIKETWNQVKNLSEELWKKHEPALSKMASKITERVKTFSDNIHKKIHQKTSKWFRKHRKGAKDERVHRSCRRDGRNKRFKDNSEEQKSTWKQRREKYKSHKKSEKKSHKEDMENRLKKKYEKSRKRQEKNEEKVRKRINKSFQHLKKLMGEMSEEKHLWMTKSDIQEVCDFFTSFHTQWDIYKRLKYTDVQWIFCQLAWWESRLNDQIHLVGLKCMDKIYGWQLEWSPSGDEKGNFRKKRGKGYNLGKKLRKKILERNHAAGKPYSYENEKQMNKNDESKNRTEWYEQRARDREAYREDGGEKHKQGDWYEELMKNRLQQRKDEHKSDWVFERAADREKGRENVIELPYRNLDSNMDSDGQADPRDAWLFARAEHREYHNTRPDSWYWDRAEAREESHDNDYDEDEDDNYDDDLNIKECGL